MTPAPLRRWRVRSVTLVGCIIAASLAGYLTNTLGRQPVILFCSVVFMAGSAVLSTAQVSSESTIISVKFITFSIKSTFWGVKSITYGLCWAECGLLVAQNFEMLLVGRFIVGLAVGLASMSVPVYIAEAAPPANRGQLVTVNNVFVTGGQFVACIVDALFSKVDYPHGWRYMLGLAAVPAVVMFVGFLFLPESPRWLAQHKGEAAARKVLQRIRGKSNVEDELGLILDQIRQDEGLVEAGLWQALQEAPLRRAILLGCMLQLIQQLTGINTVMYYCGTIFVMAGYTDPTVAIWLTAGVSFIGWACCFLGVIAVRFCTQSDAFIPNMTTLY